MSVSLKVRHRCSRIGAINPHLLCREDVTMNNCYLSPIASPNKHSPKRFVVGTSMTIFSNIGAFFGAGFSMGKNKKGKNKNKREKIKNPKKYDKAV